jgi:Domain of unknown function (DUF397)
MVAELPAQLAGGGKQQGRNHERNRWPALVQEQLQRRNGCVEIAHRPERGVALRDTKDRDKAPHCFDRDEWQAFLTGAKAGEFDLPA